MDGKRHRLVRQALLLAAAATLLAALMPGSVAVAGTPVDMTISVGGNPIPEGPATAEVTLNPNPGGGTLTWYLGFGLPTQVDVDPDGTTSIDLGTLTSTVWTLEVSFNGFEDYDPVTEQLIFSVWLETTTTVVADRSSAVQGELPVKLTATVAASDLNFTGTVTFLDDVGGDVVELGPVAVDELTDKAVLSTSSLRVGAHSITARFSGVPGWLDSTSSPIAVTVAADTAVHATFAAAASKFYAANDGYRDTVKLGGRLDEKATVKIKLYNGAGSLKRTWKLGTENAGAYGVTWNGKTASGARLPAGKYTAKAIIEDTKGHRKTLSDTTTLSWREVAWKTVTVRKDGDSGVFFVGEFGGQILQSPDYLHGVILDSGEMIRDCESCGFAAGRYRFSFVTSNVLAYRNTWTEVRGHGFDDREHTGTTSIVDPATGEFGEGTPNPLFDEDGVTFNLLFGPKYIDENGRIEIWVWMTQAWGDAFDLRYLKLNYQYAVWK